MEDLLARVGAGVKRVPRLGTTADGVFGQVAVAVVGLISFVGTVTPSLGWWRQSRGLEKRRRMLLAVFSAFLLLGRLSGELGNGGTIAEQAGVQQHDESVDFILRCCW